MKKRNLTAAQIAKSKARKDRFKDLCAKLAGMTEAERVAIAEQAGVTTCEGHSLSVMNTNLVWMQMPTASVVGGFRQWIRQGRCVRKGESSQISIWVPTFRTVEADNGEESERRGFMMTSVFDISQTVELGAEAEETAQAVAA